MVIEGLGDSSIKYKSRRDGRARKIRINAGKIVQITSISCASKVYREVKEFIVNENAPYITSDKIIVIITIA